MKKPIIIGILGSVMVIAVIAVIAVVLRPGSISALPAGAPPVSARNADSSAPRSIAMPETGVRQGNPVKRPAAEIAANRVEPAEVRGFWTTWSDERKLEAVTTLARDPLWTKEMTAFAREVLRAKELDPFIKNNMACGLISQRTPPSELAGDLASMMHDVEEDPVWRDYCLQFLAAMHGQDATLAAVIETELGAVVRSGSGPIVGTAVLHLSRWQESATAQEVGEFDAMLATLTKRYAHDEVVMPALLGAIAERGGPVHVDVVRESSQSPSSAVRRSALAALGSIGDGHDVPRLRTAASGPDENGIASAAKAALERLSAKLKEGQIDFQ